MTIELAAKDPASPWMKHLERAHGLVHEAARAVGDEAEPSLHLAPAARLLERALGTLYDAFDGRADRATSMNLAHGRLWDAAILLARAGLGRAVAALREACAELVSAEERFPRVPLAPPEARPLQASADLPRLHAVDRPSLTPRLSAPPIPEPEEEMPADTLPEPTTFAELAAAAEAVRKLAIARVRRAMAALPAAPTQAPSVAVEPPPGFALVPAPALGEDDFVRRWARECFDEVGMIGLQRAPLSGDAFRSSHPLERRMLVALDAIAALGPAAVAAIEPLAMDAPAVNPMAVFAVSMIGGCLDGRDALACAERVVYRFGPNDPAVAEPFASAMKLAPSPFVPSALRALAASRELGCRRLGIEVLAHRGWLTAEELAALADEQDARVLALALPALAAARHPDLGRALVRALVHDDLGVQEAALDAMALAAHGDAASAARAAASGALGDRALLRLAIVGDQADARWLLARMQASPTTASVEAVGWSGLVTAVPALIALLEGDSEGLARSAGAALDRLLGANLREAIEVFPEAIEDVPVVDPDPEPSPPRPSLAALTGDPRDPPPRGSPEKLEVPSADPARWRAFWAEHAHRFDPAQRVRRGNPYSPSVSLYELDQLPLPAGERRVIHRELAARTGKLTAFDPHDLVVVQERGLIAWASLVAAAGEAPGSWGRAIAR
jgi:hypothetical protein